LPTLIIAETQIWLLANIAPIKDDKSRVVLYLCQFKDITPLKQPLDDENNKGNLCLYNATIFICNFSPWP
jgi:hypothetical protein